MLQLTSYRQQASVISATSTFSYLWLMVLVLLLTAIPNYSAGQPAEEGSIEIEPNGQLWIEGSASVTDYTCRAEELSGNGAIENTQQPRQNVQGKGSVAVQVSIPVKSLECGKRKMNKDMYQALKTEEHPYIRYQLLEAARIDSQTMIDSSWMDIQTRGILEIAGVQDTSTVTIQGMLLSPSRFRVKGAKRLDMHEFDITPPSALFGLIKASPELTVYFDVTVRLKE